MRMRTLSVGALACALAAGSLAGCQGGTFEEAAEVPAAEQKDAATSLWSAVDMTAWNYSEEGDVYWQAGISYCQNPADASYETLGLYVPAAYFKATDNGNGTYTCEIDPAATVGGYTASTAPVVLPVETPGYMAMDAPAGYVSSAKQYTDAGFVYVYAGCRGRDAGAPAGVTDLKAAIRYVRSNEGVLPGAMDRIFSFGMSGGGAQSAVLGASGDSALYEPYLQAIGAVEGVSDAVNGAMCWCPVTSLDTASEAYEWNMGSTRTDLSAENQALSDAMAEQFALSLNALGLTDEDGNVLTLVESDEGVYQSGTYYDYLKKVIEGSLDNFLADTTFPYTVQSGGKGGFGTFDDSGAGGDFGGSDGEGGFPGPDGDGDFAGPDGGTFPGPDGDGDFAGPDGQGGKGGNGGRGGAQKGDLPEIDGEKPTRDGMGGMGGGTTADAQGADDGDYAARDNIARTENAGGITLSGTYDTPQAYIDALNADGTWVTYDAETNTATITSIADFANALKRASKSIGAFDALDESQGENVLFGDGDGEGDHFDATMAELLHGTEYGDAYASDLARTDALGTSVQTRLAMYSPLYYLVPSSEGYDTSEVAKFWRIRSGINQGDTALATEVNLALALENDGADVDFETVWGQGHVKAERTGSADENFIAWVQECCQ